MPALSGLLEKTQSKLGYNSLKKITPQENLKNVRAQLSEFGKATLDAVPGETPNVPLQQNGTNNSGAPAAAASSNLVSNKDSATQAASKQEAGASDGTKQAAQPAATQIPPPGILPGTPAYSQWLKDNPPPVAADPPEPSGGGVTPDGGPGVPAGGGLVIKSKSSRGGKGFSKDVTIPEEMLSSLSPEMRADLDKAAGSGNFSAFTMKYWGDPKVQELTNYVRKGRVGGFALSKKGGAASFGGGNTGIKWMDQRYNDNMAKWQAEEDARNKPQIPASGKGKWGPGPAGPVWQPELQPFLEDPGFSTGGSMRQDPNGNWYNVLGDQMPQMPPQQYPNPNYANAYPQQGLPPYLQQYLMMQQQLSQGQYPGAY